MNKKIDLSFHEHFKISCAGGHYDFAATQAINYTKTHLVHPYELTKNQETNLKDAIVLQYSKIDPENASAWQPYSLDKDIRHLYEVSLQG